MTPPLAPPKEERCGFPGCQLSTRYAKRLIQYGVRRLYFERRPYERCRGIELIILTGDPDAPPAPSAEREG